MIEAFTESGLRCIVVDDLATLERMVTFLEAVQAKDRWVGFDTETTSRFVPRAELVGLSFAVSAKEGFYIPVGHDYGEQLDWPTVASYIKGVLVGPGITCANGKFDIRVMRKAGLELRLSGDSMSVTRLLGEVEYGVGLKPTIKRFYGEEVTEFTDVVPRAQKGKPQPTFAQVEITEAAKYAVPDAVNCWRLTVDGLARLPQEAKALLVDLEFEVMRLAADQEDHGLPVDAAFVNAEIEAGRVIEQQLYHEAIQELDRLAAARGKSLPTPAGGVNLNSTPQLQEILFDICGLPVVKKTKPSKKFPLGQPSADASVLEKLAARYGPVDKIARYRSAQTSIGRFEEFLEYGVERDGWLFTHASLNPTGTATGRYSGSAPNTQNLPKFKTVYETGVGTWAFKLRDAVCVPPGHGMVSADYSQIELRVAAGLSGCRAWVDAYARGDDLHRVTAAAALGIPFESVTEEQRQIGKALNFSMLYGAQAANVAEQLGISVELAQQFIDGFWSGLPEVASWVAATEAFCRKNGWTATHFGRRRMAPDVYDSRRGIAAKALREAVNLPVQGTAADVLKIALSRQWEEMRAMDAMAFMLVHDQIVWMVPQSVTPAEFCERIRKRVEVQIPGFPEIVVDFGVGQRLGSLVEYKGRPVPDRWEDVVAEEREAAIPQLEVVIEREITKVELGALKELVLEHPGEARVRLICAQGEFALKEGTALGVQDRLRWQAAVAGALIRSV